MDPETLFRVGNVVALIGWVSLFASPWSPTAARTLAGVAIPSLLALAYAGILVTSFGDAEGDFFTLAGVMELFTQPMAVVMGWLHYLAFDLFVGAWITFDARARGVRFALVLPPLLLTLMVGPIGLLTYLLLLLVTGRLVKAGTAPIPR